jgi:hypothetical protein
MGMVGRMSPKESPDYWRDRAEEIRVVADVMIDPPARDMLLQIAASYDLIARRLEEKEPLQLVGL